MHSIDIFVALMVLVISGVAVGTIIFSDRIAPVVVVILTVAAIGGVISTGLRMQSLSQGLSRTSCEPSTHSWVWLGIEDSWRCVPLEDQG